MTIPDSVYRSLRAVLYPLAIQLISSFFSTESKIEAQTSAATQRAKIGNDVTLWCNATGYPKPVVYWTREDRNKQLPDGSHQYWVSLV